MRERRWGIRAGTVGVGVGVDQRRAGLHRRQGVEHGRGQVVGDDERPASAADPTGTWLTEDGRARVRTERCAPRNADLCDHVVRGSQPIGEAGTPKTDRFNPDPRRRGRLLPGHQRRPGLKPTDDGRYAREIYGGDGGDAEPRWTRSRAWLVAGTRAVL